MTQAEYNQLSASITTLLEDQLANDEAERNGMGLTEAQQAQLKAQQTRLEQAITEHKDFILTLVPGSALTEAELNRHLRPDMLGERIDKNPRKKDRATLGQPPGQNHITTV